MIDPERISKRSYGLAGELVRAGSDEQPSSRGVESTLAALGLSGAALTTPVAAGAGAKLGGAAVSSGGAGIAAAGATSATATKAVTVALLVRWVSLGMLSGVTVFGAAALVSEPASQSPPAAAAKAKANSAIALPASGVAAKHTTLSAPFESAAPAESSREPVVGIAAPPPRNSTKELARPPQLEVGAPLAAEVAFIDDARALLSSGRAEQGLALLSRYERVFPGPRLLPEALFLSMETCERLGRLDEARAAAERLLRSFPRSPHTAHARKLLGE